MPYVRPNNELELQRREAVGVIRASRFVREYANSHQPITTDTVLAIHQEIFSNAWPEIAGRYRVEELSITDSELLLPHHLEVPKLIEQLNGELKEYLRDLEGCEGKITSAKDRMTDEVAACIEKVVHVSGWLHHGIARIHPFREGNGRTARLAGNLILERYGLVGISVKIERENKDAYRQALRQIDNHGDYEPLEAIISEGLIERYNGVAVKYYQP